MSKSPGRVLHLTANASSSSGTRVKNTRQLWLEQPFPDNYTDESFLRSLRVSMRSRTRSYWQVVRDSSAITQQVDTVALVAAVSVYLYKASSLICCICTLFVACMQKQHCCLSIAALVAATVLLVANIEMPHC